MKIQKNYIFFLGGGGGGGVGLGVGLRGIKLDVNKELKFL